MPQRRIKPTKRSTSTPRRRKPAPRRATKKRARNTSIDVSPVSQALMDSITSIDRNATYTTSRDGAKHLAEKRTGGVVVYVRGDRGFVATTRAAVSQGKRSARVPNPMKLRAGKAVSLHGRKSIKLVKRGGKAYLEVR